MARGGGVKARKSVEIDNKYSALKRGKRVSERYAYVDIKGGGTYRRRNANQYGKTKGGGVYYEHHENRVDNGRFLAYGGYVSKGEMVWKKLTASEKIDFLYKNFTPTITPRSQELLVGKAFKFLPKNVKIVIQSKYANEE